MNFIDLDKSKLNNPDYVKSLIKEMQICSTIEQSAKLSLNSIYGALANKHFFWKITALAEATTLQGQDAIKMTEDLLNHYVKKILPNNRKVLDLLGFPKESQLIINQPVVIYIDTDSVVFDTKNNIKETWIEIELEDDTILKLQPTDFINIIRNNIKTTILVKDLLNTDEIDI